MMFSHLLHDPDLGLSEIRRGKEPGVGAIVTVLNGGGNEHLYNLKPKFNIYM